jgi:ribosome hibernation promoting factor
MNITTTARHCELEPEVRQFAQERLSKLSRFARDILEAHVVVTAEKYRHSAEIMLRLKRHEMVSREEANDARAAIDQAAGRLEHQMRRLKEKRLERKRGARARSEANGLVPVEPPPEGDDTDWLDDAIAEE